MIRRLFSKFFGTKKKALTSLVVLVVLALVLKNTVFKPKAVVVVGEVKRGPVTEELVLSGEIQADEHANMAFQTSGELAYLGVNEGDEVKRGDVLARLDTTVLYQTYLQAEATLRKYQASLDNTYDQLQGHENDESYTQIESRTSAEVNKDNAYRSFVVAQKNLSNSTLRAPFDGVVSAVTYPYTGINTVFTQPQIELFNPHTIYFDVSADQTEVIKLEKGTDVKIYLDSYPDDEIDGVVGFVGSTPKVGEAGAVYKIKVLFVSNMSDYQKFKLGMTGDAKFITDKKSDTLYVSVDFLKADANGRYLNVGNSKNKIYVDVGLEGEDYIEIISDKVSEGDKVYD